MVHGIIFMGICPVNAYISRLMNNIVVPKILTLFMSPMGTSYLANTDPSSSTHVSGFIPASAQKSSSCIIATVASVDSARGMFESRSALSCMWSSMHDTTGNAWAELGRDVIADPAPPGD